MYKLVYFYNEIEHEVWDNLENIVYYQTTISSVGVSSVISRLSKVELMSIATQWYS
ncbi:MAG: hypothetical protein FWF56_06295 [Firmicutes bacterium]|nr:hypothetical protein [Bacillota bacterium]MCL1953422.1 hypothetical protein [Bacillota bacterium]